MKIVVALTNIYERSINKNKRYVPLLHIVLVFLHILLYSVDRLHATASCNHSSFDLENAHYQVRIWDCSCALIMLLYAKDKDHISLKLKEKKILLKNWNKEMFNTILYRINNATNKKLALKINMCNKMAWKINFFKDEQISWSINLSLLC